MLSSGEWIKMRYRSFTPPYFHKCVARVKRWEKTPRENYDERPLFAGAYSGSRAWGLASGESLLQCHVTAARAHALSAVTLVSSRMVSRSSERCEPRHLLRKVPPAATHGAVLGVVESACFLRVAVLSIWCARTYLEPIRGRGKCLNKNPRGKGSVKCAL